VNGNSSSSNLFSRNRPTTLRQAFVALTLISLAALPVFAWIGHWRAGYRGVAAALVAAATCWAGAAAALILGGVLQSTKNAVHGILLGMVFRMGVPLAVGLVLHRWEGPLAEAGVFGMILGFYFVTLAAETLLSLRMVASADKNQKLTKTS
jgi:hypothetical protein